MYKRQPKCCNDDDDDAETTKLMGLPCVLMNHFIVLTQFTSVMYIVHADKYRPNCCSCTASRGKINQCHSYASDYYDELAWVQSVSQRYEVHQGVCVCVR